MPKGDRFKLKADPEDGTTPIANLLLEAVAMAKLSGLQKGAILFLWRKTYGWIGEDGQRKKECEIGLKEWTMALDAIKSSVATALAELEQRHIFIRTMKNPWQVYCYKLNTNVAEWDSNCLNLVRLAETVQLSKTVQSSLPEQLAPTIQSNPEEQLAQTECTVSKNRTLQLSKTVPPTLYKEILNKYINKVFSHWNSQKLITHRKLTPDIERTVQRTLADYTEEEICQSISNYAEIVHSELYYFKYKWTLKDFLTRGLMKFLDLPTAKENYLKDSKNATHSRDNQQNGESAGNPGEDSSKYTSGKYGRFVQS